MSTRSEQVTETIQAVLIGAALVLVGVALLLGDILIPRSTLGGGLLALAGACYLASAALRFRRRRRARTRR